MDMKTLFAGAALVVLLAASGRAGAAEFEVKELNKGSQGGMMVFEPAFVRIAPGDTVRFVAADKGHDAETIPHMLPDGATPFKAKMNEDMPVTFDKPGVYGVRCTPHYGMGMVAMVVVGDPVNEDAAKAMSQPGKAKQTFNKLFEQLDTAKAASN
jgi:pseudoazurin